MKTKITFSEAQFIELLNNNPELTAHGLGVDLQFIDPGVTPEEKFKQERDKAFGMYDAFLASVDWIQDFAHYKIPNETSYGLKHDVERWAHADVERKVRLYVPEGAFIAAAIALGIRTYPINRRSPSVRFHRRRK
jgi:hypothetical protein